MNYTYLAVRVYCGTSINDVLTFKYCNFDDSNDEYYRIYNDEEVKIDGKVYRPINVIVPKNKAMVIAMQK